MKHKAFKFPFARLASALLLLVLVSSYATSGLFAKYVTSGSSSDAARAAKWGVQITGGGGLFASTYRDANGNVIVETTADTDNDGVPDRILAPGTEGTMTDIQISGAPEVAVRIKYVPTVTLTNWSVDSAFYCPIRIYVNGTLVTQADSAEAYIANIRAAIEAQTREYSAGTDLSTTANDRLQIRWEWPIDGDEEDDDEKDTALGDAATPATIAITVQTVVEQIDQAEQAE